MFKYEILFARADFKLFFCKSRHSLFVARSRFSRSVLTAFEKLCIHTLSLFADKVIE